MFNAERRKKLSALVIIPTYEERDNLEPLAEAVLDQGALFAILIIDDGSPDGTGELAEKIKTRHPDRVEVLHRNGKLGLASAYLMGFRWGIEQGYEYIFEMDADFSHNPEFLPSLLQAAQNGADVVLGSRYVHGGAIAGWSPDRLILSYAGSYFAKGVLGLPISDLTGGFKCFRREALQTIDLNGITSTGYAFQIEVTYRCYQHGLKIVEVPIVFGQRKSGNSKMSGGIILEAAWLVWRLRFEAIRGGVLVAESPIGGINEKN